MYTTNYQNTFIEVSEDCPVSTAEVPPQKSGKKTVARLQYEMIIAHPYKYTSDDVIFTVHALRNGIPEEEYGEEREIFFSKGQACMRSSPLTKRYGWGVHSGGEGKIAIYPVESREYRKLQTEGQLVRKKAMRNRRK